MALEGKDINDNQIIDSTEKAVNDRGFTQFRITLPSGRKVESEWLNPDNVKKALLPWIETIRGQMVQDAEDVRAEARRKAQELARQIIVPAAEADQFTGTTSLSEVSLSSITNAVPTSAFPTSAPGTSMNSGPDAFARNGLALARQQAEYWQRIAADAMQKAIAAQADVTKWEQILSAIGGGVMISGNRSQGSGSGHSENSSNSLGSGPISDRVRKVRSDKGKPRVPRG